MNITSVQPKSDRRSWIILLLVFVALWTVTAATWMYDEAGYTVGMPGLVFILHLAAPLAVGLVVGWRKLSLVSGAKVGAFAGALFGAANIAVQLLWGGVLYLLGRIPPDQPFTILEGLFEVFEFLLLFTIIGLILGAIGGLLSAAISARMRGE